MITSTHLVAEICTDIAKCPPYTTSVQTSFIHITDTTTICLLSSMPSEYALPVTTITALSIASSVLPTDSGIHVSIALGSYISGYPSVSVTPQTTVLPTEISSSGIYTMPRIVPSQWSSSISTVVTPTLSPSVGYSVHTPTPSTTSSVSSNATITGVVSVSIVIPPASNTENVGTSYSVSSTGSRSVGTFSGGYVVPPSSAFAPTSITAPSSIWLPSNELTIPSGYPAIPSRPTGPRSSGYTTSPGSSVILPIAYPSRSLETAPSTYMAVTPGISGYDSLLPPVYFNSTVVESTVVATNYQTQTFTSYVAASTSSGVPDNHTGTVVENVPTYIQSGVSSGPSGLG
jgi:hypothetical protein